MSLKISIITPTYNHGKYIKDTIESVLAQNYTNFEHIIVDGGSTDDTIQILSEYSHLKWISEKDNGPVDAINKGFNLVTGNIVTWINSDDYFESNIFQEVAGIFESDRNINLLIGSLTFVDENKNLIHIDKTHKNDIDFLINQSADLVRQPCSFFSKEIFQKINKLDVKLKLAFDYDMFIKMLKLTQPYFIERNLAYQRDFSDTLSRKFIRKQALEIFRISQKNGGKFFSKLNYTNLKKIILRKL